MKAPADVVLHFELRISWSDCETVLAAGLQSCQTSSCQNCPFATNSRRYQAREPAAREAGQVLRPEGAPVLRREDARCLRREDARCLRGGGGPVAPPSARAVAPTEAAEIASTADASRSERERRFPTLTASVLRSCPPDGPIPGDDSSLETSLLRLPPRMVNA
jgi:hypothetical protein